MIVVPDYYDEFCCIKDKCRHNCCIGWEIDIDERTFETYRNINGKIGDRLKKNISLDGMPHFVLGTDERCPFLNKNNLCDIIIELGDDHLCDICREHPRFENELPDRVEKGLGLCCEAAARLILTRKDPMRLLNAGETEDDIILLRDKIIKVLQHRELDINSRIAKMLFLCGTTLPENDMMLWVDRLLSLERLSSDWTETLKALKANYSKADLKAFEGYIADRQTEYEQLAVYFIYRHFANADTLSAAAARARFAALCVMLAKAIGAVTFKLTGSFDTEAQIELARMLSSEIEYSDENLYAILDELEF